MSVDELKPLVDRTVQKFLGFSEPALVAAALTCLDKGYDKRKTKEKLGMILEDQHVTGFVDKLFGTIDEYRASAAPRTGRKRKDEPVEVQEATVEKRAKPNEPEPIQPEFAIPEPAKPPGSEPGTNSAMPSPGQLTADKIKEMMEKAQRDIQLRKAQIQATMPVVPPLMSVPTQPVSTQAAAHMTDAMEKARRAAELQTQIQSQLARAGIQRPAQYGMTTVAPAAAEKPEGGSRATPLLLDEMGRTIDAMTGEVITLTAQGPTLKANIRAKRREEFRSIIEKPAPPEVLYDAPFYDARVAGKGAQRTRRAFKFHDPGRFEQMAARLRTKAQLDKLQNEIAQAAKKTGIASAARLATILPKKELREGEVPDTEWWDTVILKTESYGEEVELVGVTHLVEHPSQMKPPAESDKTPEISLILTKKERKKLRRQTRSEAQKEETEKIRLGLAPPPEPKVRMANLMRVLGTEAVQDPTKVEQHVREQMAKRQRAHEQANASRKLTKDQRREKKMKKLKEDTTLGVHVHVYRIRSLHNPSKKFKVETNANQLFLTGMVVLHRVCNVVVIEGGPRQLTRFRRLMLHRIKWSEDPAVPKEKEEEEEEDGAQEDEGEIRMNKCDLVWEGEVKQRAFGEMKFKACPTESFARDQFRRAGVEHYWDLAYSGSVLEQASEETT